MAEQKQGDQLDPTYSSSVRIRGVARSNERLGELARKGQGYPCQWHDMMMMMICKALDRFLGEEMHQFRNLLPYCPLLKIN